MSTNQPSPDKQPRPPKSDTSGGAPARRGKIVRSSPLSNQLPGKIAGTVTNNYNQIGGGTAVSRGTMTTTTSTGNSFAAEIGGSREDGTWLIEAIAVAISNISPPRGAAVRAMARLLVERSNVGARSAAAIASEFAGVESEETCHAIAVLCSDGWAGSLAELVNAARHV